MFNVTLYKAEATRGDFWCVIFDGGETAYYTREGAIAFVEWLAGLRADWRL